MFLAFIETERQSIRYRLSEAASGNISGVDAKNLGVGSVRTLDGVLASLPLEVGTSHFLASGDPRIASLYLAETAGFINAEILVQQPGISSCTCDDKMCHQQTHYCQSCLRERLCASLSDFVGARICKRCKIKRTSLSDEPTTSVPEAIMNKSVRHSHRAECRLLKKPVDSANEEKRYNDMVAWFRKNYRANNVWFDDYASLQRDLTGVEGVRAKRDPLVCSGDAIEPYAESHDGTMRVHTAENMAMCTSGYNYIKQRQLVAFLQELAEYEKLGTPHTPEQRAAFVEICNDLYIVSMKTPFTKKARTQGRGLKDLQADRAEWRCGRPTNEAGPWNLMLWRWNLGSSQANPAGWAASTWTQEAIEGLSGLSDEIQQHFGVQLEKNDDGSPKLYKSWKDWNTAMERRLTRMRVVCNRHGISKWMRSFEYLL